MQTTAQTNSGHVAGGSNKPESRVQPDEFDRHELMDRIHCINEMFDSLISDHPAAHLIAGDIEQAGAVLADLYQKAGEVNWAASAALAGQNVVADNLDCSTPTSEQPREILIQRLEACQRILADERAAQPDGWKLVPIEPTEAMLVAMDDAFTWQRAGDGTTPAYYGPKEDRFADHKDAYRATLAKAGAA